MDSETYLRLLEGVMRRHSELWAGFGEGLSGDFPEMLADTYDVISSDLARLSPPGSLEGTHRALMETFAGISGVMRASTVSDGKLRVPPELDEHLVAVTQGGARAVVTLQDAARQLGLDIRLDWS
ncbi:MAG: hypothetical protein C0506_03250 [Anaerolinea sp.]|nr:hypothetical protein [Anaerolinea sp.]